MPCDDFFDFYVSPFCTRYASSSMSHVFSPKKKIETWRKLWVALAESEKELGLPISDEQIAELKSFVSEINFELASTYEKKLKHDVMAHIYAYSEQCPKAAKIIHLGATSCYVVDNADIIAMKEGLELVHRKLLGTISLLANFARKTKNIACLAYTHLQPAQLTTIGKRAVLWLNEFCLDEANIARLLESLQLLGCKGTTGTQSSFLNLFEGDEQKVEQLEKKIVEKMGFKSAVDVSGQTYSRKIDYFVCSALSGFAQSAMKFANDMRLLQSFQELEEPFSSSQIGSSAMPYKKNPMKCERICALARHLISNALNPAFTAGCQWLERTLDDSANKRISISEAFLAADSILNLLNNVCGGIVVNEKIVEANVKKELPFMATENILMAATKKGGNRQELHEILRQSSWLAKTKMKEGCTQNSLIEILCNQKALNLNKPELEAILNPQNFVGLSSKQVDKFLNQKVELILKQNKNKICTESNVQI